MTASREVFDQAMRLGHSAAWDQQWERAISAYRAALAEFPDDANALSALGFAWLQSGRLEEALQCYQRAATHNPGDPLAPEKCGEIFEQLGRLSDAAQTFLAVAEVHLRRRDTPKAINNWKRVVRLTPDNLAAHSRLALAYERLGKTADAVIEYLEVARLFQRARDVDRALAAANHAQQLSPQSPEAAAAINKLHLGQALLVPTRARDTGTLPAMAAAPLPDLPGPGARPSPRTDSPLAGATAAALSALANLLFADGAELARQGAALGLFGRADSAGTPTRREAAMLVLGQAINAHSAGDGRTALSRYRAAATKGLRGPVLDLVVGALHLELGEADEAAGHFRGALGHPELGVGALFGLGLVEQQQSQLPEAANHLLEALHRLDAQMVPAGRLDSLADGYESLIDGLSHAEPAELATLVQALAQFLSGPGWQQRLRQARQQLDAPAPDGPVAPLADLVAAPGASTVVESLRRVDTYLARRQFATAMEEAYYAIAQSPGYLPIHLRVADILEAEGKTAAAVDKLSAIAATYQSRGDLARAARTLRQVLRLNPLDVDTRYRLIDLFVTQGQVDEALQQYQDLADTHYQLADLDAAYTTYSAALQLAHAHNRGAETIVRLLHKLGDINLQRLNWREAQVIYTQIGELAPDDHAARATLIDLLFRLGNNHEALAAVDGYVRHLLARKNSAAAISLLTELIESLPAELGLVARLARLYQDLGRRDDAISQYDQLGELQLQAGQTAQAAETIRTILALNPPEASGYEALLAELQAT